jgi:integrase
MKRKRITILAKPKEPFSRKGRSCMVEPIKNPEDLERIKKLLKDKPRDLALFTLGINSGLRGGDILSLTVGQVKNAKPGDIVHIKEKKTGKQNYFVINHAIHKTLKTYLNAKDVSNDERLFPITIQRFHQLVRKWTMEAGIHGNFGTHSLRKTFGYMQRIMYCADWNALASRFNHASPKTTERYLGIGDEEINSMLMNEI